MMRNVFKGNFADPGGVGTAAGLFGMPVFAIRGAAVAVAGPGRSISGPVLSDSGISTLGPQLAATPFCRRINDYYVELFIIYPECYTLDCVSR